MFVGVKRVELVRCFSGIRDRQEDQGEVEDTADLARLIESVLSEATAAPQSLLKILEVSICSPGRLRWKVLKDQQHHSLLPAADSSVEQAKTKQASLRSSIPDGVTTILGPSPIANPTLEGLSPSLNQKQVRFAYFTSV